jgi:competence protein ComFC
MKFSFDAFVRLLFPSPYNADFLENIPPAPEPPHRDIFALYNYHSRAGKKIIYAIKSKQDRFLSQDIAEKMFIHLQEYLSEQSQFSYFMNPLIIPVPLGKKQLRSRGFNQIGLIGNFLAHTVNGLYAPIVIKNRETKKQALITNKSQRFLNVRDCFTVPEKNIHHIYNSDIIVVDDLITTGATLQEMIKVLKKHGARNIIAITVGH